MAKQFLIDEELANKIIDMLDEKPFKEVYEVMEGLLHLKEAPTIDPITPLLEPKK